MNGMATVSPFFTPNLCQCGHDYLVHNIAGNTCSMCSYTGGTLNRHSFAGVFEILPASSFIAEMIYGYINPGGFGRLIPLVTQNASNVLVGATSIPVNSIVGILPGMTFITFPINPGNQSSYRITSTTPGSPPSINFTPGLLFNVGPSTNINVYGSFGSTMGPGMPGNSYQRGG